MARGGYLSSSSGGGGGAGFHDIGLTVVGDDKSFIDEVFHLDSSETLELKAGGINNDSGDSPSGLDLEIIERSSGNVLYTISQKYTASDPLTTISGGKDIVIKAVNNTGSTQSVGGFIRANIQS